MKRRGFLGFIGGAAAAGPSVARAAIAELPKGIGAASGFGVPTTSGYGLSQAANSIDGDWRLKEILNLRRILSGEMTEEEKEQDKRRRLYSLQNTINQNVAGLQSVSGVHKLRMYDDQTHRLNQRIQRSETKSYLARLLKEAK